APRARNTFDPRTAQGAPLAFRDERTRFPMHTRLKGLLVLAGLAAAAGTAGAADNFFLTLQPQSKLWVEGTSTVRGFTCEAGEVDAVVQVASPAAVKGIVAGEKTVSAVEVKVPAGKLDCGN